MNRRPVWQLASVVLVATLAVLLLATHALVVLDRLDRALDHDEAQHLHIAWLTAQGLRPFVDFDEHHAPFLHTLLTWLMPTATNAQFPLLDVPTFAARARILSSVTGTAAVAAAALLAHRATGRAASALLTATLLLGARFFWMRGIADVRTDPLALMLFWSGVVLVTLGGTSSARAGATKGLGAALVFLAFLVNPKWPLMTAVVCVWALAGVVRLPERRLRAAGAGLSVVGAVVALAAVFIAGRVGLWRYAMNVLAFTALIRGDFTHPMGMNDELQTPFHYCAPVFHPWIVLSVVALGGLLVWRDRERYWSDPRSRVRALVFVLLVASAIELRFVYPYPRLWQQYYLGWSVCAALAYALVVEVVRDAVARSRANPAPRLATAVPVASCVAAFVLYVDFVAHPARNLAEDLARWSAISYEQISLEPGDRVWVRGDANPIGARDASYYWVAFLDLVPASLAYSESHADQDLLPRSSDDQLPPCRVLAGEEDDVRFFSMEWRDYGHLPKTAACLRRLVADGRLCATPFPILARVPHAGTDCAGSVTRSP